MTGRILTRAIILGWVGLGFACTHTPRMEEFEAGIGHLTQDELMRQFGYPQRLKRLANGEEAWEYEFLSGRSRCVGYRVFFDENQLSRRWEPLACRAAS